MHVDELAFTTSRNPFSKPVLINDRQFTGLIDTGCSSVLVRESAARVCGLEIPSRSIPLYTVGDVQLPRVNKVGEASADVTVDGVVASDHSNLVVADRAIPVDVLIGCTWLELPHIGYYKRGDELVIESNSVIDVDVLSETTNKPYMVCLSEDDTNDLVKEPIGLGDITVATDATEGQRKDLLKLLNDYRAAFAKNIFELGCTNVVQMDIIGKSGSTPVCAKSYRTSPSDRLIIADIIHKWSKAGLVTDSTSPYASPVLLVNKTDNEKRLCVDYRRLNDQTDTPLTRCRTLTLNCQVWRLRTCLLHSICLMVFCKYRQHPNQKTRPLL